MPLDDVDMIDRLAVALAVALLLPSCALFPSVWEDGPGVRVGGDTQAVVDDVLATCVTRAAEVRALLPATHDEPVVYRLQDSVRGGFTSDRDITGAHVEPLGWVFLDVDEMTHNTIVHESVHALLGPRWGRLPLMLEEGLADTVAMRLTDDSVAHESELLTALWLLLPGFEGRFIDGESGRVLLTVESIPEKTLTVEELYGVDKLDLWFMDRGDFALAYAAGVLVVTRIIDRAGYDGLLALSDRAARHGLCEVPLDDALAAAELTRDFASWRVPALEMLDERATILLAEQVLRKADEVFGLVDALSDIAVLDWEIEGAHRVRLGSGAEAFAAARGTVGTFVLPESE